MSKNPQSAAKPPLQMMESRESVSKKLAERASLGRGFLQRFIGAGYPPSQFEGDHRKWTDYNRSLLKSLFNSEEPAEEYYRWLEGGIDLGDHSRSPEERVKSHRSTMEEEIHRLESLLGRLDTIQEATNFNALRPPRTASRSGVFIVHGHNEAARQSVVRVIEGQSLEAIVLHEQPSGGKTLIEMLEVNSDVGFAVVLLTPDDVGRATEAAVDNPRARQNVILELGYFIGKIGRPNVCVLYKGDVELPSDFFGVVYVPMDDAGAWQFKLVKELDHAGFSVDTNKLSF